MKKIIINGANGYVASHFIHHLLSKNYEVIALVRGGDNGSSFERMRSVLYQIDEENSTEYKNLSVYDYSLLDKNFSIPAKELKRIFSGDVEYFHFAASLKFDLKSREEIFAINEKGVENSIKIFSKFAGERSRFFFIGTAYSCGRMTAEFEEKFYPNEDISAFRNYYEQSKRFGENVMKKYIEEKGLNGHVIRLSQVAGNNKTGVTLTDYGMFDFAKRIYHIAYKIPGLTIRVQVNPETTQNQIAIDTVVDYFMQTLSAGNVPVIMNFVGAQRLKNIHIANSLNALLPIKVIPLKTLHRNEMNAMERMMALGMTFMGNYIDTNFRFGTSKRDSIIDSGKNEVDEKTAHRMLTYFIERLSREKGKQAIARAV